MHRKKSLGAENGGKHHVIPHGTRKMLCGASGTEIAQRMEGSHWGGDWEPACVRPELSLSVALSLSVRAESSTISFLKWLSNAHMNE